jgi:hypothetical protein
MNTLNRSLESVIAVRLAPYIIFSHTSSSVSIAAATVLAQEWKIKKQWIQEKSY